MKEEYICPMPFDVDTANIGLRWWACQALQNFTGNGEGVEWAVNEPYDPIVLCFNHVVLIILMDIWAFPKLVGLRFLMKRECIQKRCIVV